MSLKTSSPSASDATNYPSTVIIDGNRYEVCPCCGLPKPPEGSKLRRIGKLTCRLLRQAGYRVVGWRRAWLFEDAAQEAARTGQQGLFEDVAPSRRVRGRLSFFRRLHLAKGGVAAQWEDVFFAELSP